MPVTGLPDTVELVLASLLCRQSVHSFKICENHRGVTTMVLRFEPVETVCDPVPVQTSSPTLPRRKSPCQVRRDCNRMKQHNVNKMSTFKSKHHFSTLNPPLISSGAQPTAPLTPLPRAPPTDSGVEVTVLDPPLDTETQDLCDLSLHTVTQISPCSTHMAAAQNKDHHPENNTSHPLHGENSELGRPINTLSPSSEDFHTDSDTSSSSDDDTDTPPSPLQDRDGDHPHDEPTTNQCQQSAQPSTHLSDISIDHIGRMEPENRDIVSELSPSWDKVKHFAKHQNKELLRKACAKGKNTKVNRVTEFFDPSGNNIIIADTDDFIIEYNLTSKRLQYFYLKESTKPKPPKLSSLLQSLSTLPPCTDETTLKGMTNVMNHTIYAIEKSSALKKATC